ncbi:YitT family protein [uncultured Ruthenibacterium sp.]|uniref:YitT family protein n=1 Tax=uncultured Ruthenibacterium sp. TaxID=1905347 RepID=UPI00349E98D9
MKQGFDQKVKDFLKDLPYDVVGSILYALGIYTFAKSANFAPGGVSGIALLLNYLWNLPIGTMSLVLNIPIVIISYKVLGKWFLFKSLKTMAISTLFLDVVFPLFPMYQGNPFLAAVFSGVAMGAGLALIYIRGSSTGGTDFLIVSAKKLFPHFSMGQITMLADGLIIVMGWPVYGNMDSVLYGVVSAFACSVVVDKIMYGAGSGKLAIIITTQGKPIADRIDAVVGRGATLLQAKGAYSEASREVVLCACSKSEIYKVQSAAHETDPDAFVMITEANEVFGEGFKNPQPSE